MNDLRTIRRSILWLSSDKSGDGGPRYYPHAVVKKKAAALSALGQWDLQERLLGQNLQWATRADFPETVADAKYALGAVYSKRGMFGRAIEMLAETRDQYQSIGNITGVRRANGELGMAYHRQGRNDEALECFSAQLALSQAQGNEYGVAVAQGNLGMVYSYISDFTRALDCYAKQLAFLSGTSYMGELCAVQGNIGMLHYYMEDYRTALEHFSHQRRIAEQCQFPRSIILALGNLGMAHAGLEQYQAAMENQQQQLELAQQIGDWQSACWAVGNIGAILFELGEFQKARTKYREQLAMAQESGDKQNLLLAKGNMAILMLTTDDLAGAEPTLQEAIGLATVTGSQFYRSILLDRLTELYLRTGRCQLAAQVNRESGQLLEKSRRRGQLLINKVLAAKIMSATDRSKAIETLEALLIEFTEDSQVADVLFELFQLTQDQTHRERAMALYRNLYLRSRRFHYRDRLEKLTQAGRA